MMSLPELFLQRLAQVVPSERYEQCVQTFFEPPAVGARVNTLLVQGDVVLRALQEAGFQVHPVCWYLDAFWLPTEQREALLSSEWVQQGMVYVQNLSSMIPPLALQPQPGEDVLDLCAAPGGKTLQMASLMQREGTLVAVEAVRSRFFKMRENLQRHGADWVQTVQAEGEWLWKRWQGRFDAVLLDAPCSSESRFRAEDPATFRYWSEKKIADMVRKQKSLLYSAIQCLKPGGRLVYCTCTFAPEENEAIIAHALKKFGESIEVLPLPVSVENMIPALSEWNGRAFPQPVRLARRILPSPQMEGFFVCLIRRTRHTAALREKHS
ncbi:MAG: RsmB/NOP family class I SAM-dependent RNA methyltransferase [Armatimonadota bacterium]|nr:RsmB/NOP family class I SAM-dependent RNA methyltransferase [bacterium]MDW8320852.1 RsmB/NOP family class I SAM-dependent RNA methyltransferase [Armatimonadota bacterium]